LKVKKLITIIILICIIGCEKDEQNEKYFDPKDLSKLLLENIDTFWEGENHESFNIFFDRYSGYMGGILFKDDNGRSVGVSVFESQERAIVGMDGRMNTVSALIKPGDPNEILTGQWWYGDYFVFANQWNTIIEVSFGGSNIEDLRTFLMETAAEVSKRIDLLSQ